MEGFGIVHGFFSSHLAARLFDLRVVLGSASHPSLPSVAAECSKVIRFEEPSQKMGSKQKMS